MEIFDGKIANFMEIILRIILRFTDFFLSERLGGVFLHI